MKLKVKFKVYAIKNKNGDTDYAVAKTDKQPITIGLHDDAGIYWQFEYDGFFLPEFAAEHGFEYAETEIEQEIRVKWLQKSIVL